MENQNIEKLKIRSSLLKTIIIATSLFLSAICISISYYESNRYYYINGFVIDKYNSTYTEIKN